MIRFTQRAPVCLASICLATHAAVADGPRPRFQEVIQPQLLSEADMVRLNVSADAVGSLRLESNEFTPQAILWSSQGVTHLGTLGGIGSSALGLNDNRVIVGVSDTNMLDRGGRVVSQAFVWDGTMQNLADPGSFLDSAALAVNNTGQIVGWSALEGGSRHAVLWTTTPAQAVARTVLDLGTLGGPSSLARAVNAQGVIVGEAETEIFIGDTYPVLAFRYDETGMTALPFLPEGSNSSAFDINDAGAIVGWSQTMGGNHGTVWLPDRPPIEIPTFGGDTSVALGINNLGGVVGFATVPTFDDTPLDPGLQMPVQRAFYWRDGVLIDLNALLAPDSGWVLLEARDINDSGVIVGVGLHDAVLSAFRMQLSPRQLSTITPVVEDISD
jgi:probable HAF family extracellular repeat protein